MPRAPHLEYHDQFEGVGAHELNPRYDPQEGDGYDHDLVLVGSTPTLRRVSALMGLAAAVEPPVRLDGFDASHYQYDVDPVDVDAMRLEAPQWVAWKATQGLHYVDPSLALIRPRLTAAYRRRMFYHWLSSGIDAYDQAEHFLATVGTLGPGDGVMCDAEEKGITAQGVVDFCDRCEQHTRRPAAVYTGAYVAGGTIWQNSRLRQSGYGQRPMHLAAYTTEKKARALPGVWSYPWHAWQNSSSGRYPWSSARWDTNRIDDLDVYDTACGVHPQPEQETDMEFYFNDGTPSTWRLMEDGTKRGLGFPVEYGLRGVGQPGREVQTLTPDAVAQIPDWKPPGDTGERHGTWST